MAYLVQCLVLIVAMHEPWHSRGLGWRGPPGTFFLRRNCTWARGWCGSSSGSFSFGLLLGWLRVCVRAQPPTSPRPNPGSRSGREHCCRPSLMLESSARGNCGGNFLAERPNAESRPQLLPWAKPDKGMEASYSPRGYSKGGIWWLLLLRKQQI